MSGYIGPAPVPQATQTRETFTATASQTTFATAGYTVGYLDVYLNGVHLVDGEDYTATNGSDVVLTSGAAADDVLEVVAYRPFEVVDQNFTGDFSVDTDALYVDSANNRVGIGTSSPSSVVDIAGNNNAGSAQNVLRFTDFDASASPDQPAGKVEFYSNDNNSPGVVSYIEAVVGTGADGRLTFGTGFGGSASETMRIDSSGNVGIGTTSPSATLDVNGSLSKNSGSFKIDHPVKPDTHHLVHSFVEGPQADNLYRGKVVLVSGKAEVNLDEAGRMTEGTFAALNGNVQCWTTNEDGWTQVRGKVEGNILTIEAQDPACTDEISWLVIGERKDQHMLDTEWTDENGRVITEPAKEQSQ